ncbi:hypothetical protein LINGRAHAP2_LOCUS29160 [Linum grandiflorum]
MSVSTQNPKWSIHENEALCNTWVEISEDGIGQSSIEFWERVKVIFDAKGFTTPRTVVGLHCRWRVIDAPNY